MARIFIDGFESGDVQLWDEYSNPGIVTATNEVSGDYAIFQSVTDDPYKLVKKLPNDVNELHLAFSVKPANAVSGRTETLCTFAHNGSPVLTLKRDPDGAGILQLMNGDDTETVPLTVSSLTRGVPANWTSWVVFTLQSDGTVYCKVNGRDSFTYSYGVTTINEVIIGSFSGTKKTEGYMDDIVIDTTTDPIRPRILGLKPNGEGTQGDWASSTGGPKYLEVDDVPSDEGATFILSNTNNATQTFNIESLPALYTNIRCIQVGANAWYEGAAETTQLRMVLIDALNDAVQVHPGSETHDLIQYPRGFAQVWETNPETTLAFTQSEIASLQIGVRAIDPTP